MGIIYDNSGADPLFPELQSSQHTNRIPAQSITSSSQNLSHPRYVIPAIIKWQKFPKSIQHTPLEDRIQGSAQYFPSYSIVNIYCEQVDEERGVIFAKIANRSAPRFVLPEGIQNFLTFSQ